MQEPQIMTWRAVPCSFLTVAPIIPFIFLWVQSNENMIKKLHSSSLPQIKVQSKFPSSLAICSMAFLICGRDHSSIQPFILLLDKMWKNSPWVPLFCFLLCWILVTCNYFLPGNRKKHHWSKEGLVEAAARTDSSPASFKTLLNSPTELQRGEKQLASWYRRVSLIRISTPSTRKKKRSSRKKLVGITLCIANTR